ncbi:hypothetical protein [Pigmentiphaga litoralis]|uniref:Baseplate assembly protein n=1 Tax=Pigmentiphaga litoralis TaxID=516702 RepID=A0A7Y9LIG5_9BURK|nr:hypothetical protein [Pigmentiphaga litoralis]NYE25479.1 hypothetical protein [Pigmentiphaga litoralis]NYE80909.1 hypothetical protein [Pigmentiphaga litoralis]
MSDDQGDVFGDVFGDAADADCGCCEGLPLPARPANAPGLTALRYRVDTQPGFRARMVQSLPLAGGGLARLLTRRPDDPSMALLDAAACVADVLTFYQERIANEGFLATATERRSVLELARAVGYTLRPGVAASVHLSFTVEDAPGAPGVCALAAGLPVQSIPPQGKLPQVFETRDAIVARAEWNALRPRQMRPADIAVLEVAGAPDPNGAATTRRVLALVGPVGSFGTGGGGGGGGGATAGLHAALNTADLYRLDTGLAADAVSDAIEIGQVFLSDAGAGSGAGMAAGDLLLFAARRGTALSRLVMRVVAVTPEPALHRVKVALEPLPEPAAPPPPPQAAAPRGVPYAQVVTVAPSRVAFARLPGTGTLSLTTATVANALTTRTWRENELQTLIGMQGWNRAAVVKTVSASASIAAGGGAGGGAGGVGASGAGAAGTAASGASAGSFAGVFGFGVKVGFFGNNAPKWGMLPKPDSLRSDPYPLPWDRSDTGSDGQPLAADRTIWQTSQARSQGARVYLERPVPDLVPASWVVVDSPYLPAESYAVADARAVSRADFGMSGRAMEVTLADGAQPPGALSKPDFSFRSSTAHVASRKLDLVALPIDAPVAAGTNRIELDALVLGLAVGQPLALTGLRADLAGVDAAEVAVLADVVHADGRSIVRSRDGLRFSYQRHSLRINANTVFATHGESVREVLGNGNAALGHQRFMLRRPPTTWVSAPTPDGVISTLTIRVNGVRWDPVPSLYGVGPHERVYTTRIDDEGRTEVLFGDGVSGARLPTGMVNIDATYRTGMGPDGNVAANTLTMPRAMPLGLRGVTNPLPATGAADREHLADARVHVPRSLQAFDRVVSALDYAAYARVYPGIGKARADMLWVDGQPRLALSVTGATDASDTSGASGTSNASDTAGGAVSDTVRANLAASIASVSDPSQRFDVRACALRLFRCHARVLADPRYVKADVMRQVTVALLDAFGIAAREIGQPVTAAEVIACIQSVPGVVAVDLEALALLDDAAPDGLSDASSAAASAVPAGLPAYGARWDARTRRVIPAELLSISPAALSLTDMTP